MIRIKELLQTIHPTAIFTNKSKDNGYRFSYSDKTEPCFTGKKHKNNGFVVFLNNFTGILKMFCYSQKCSRLFKLGHLYYDITYTIEAFYVNEPFIEYHDIYNENDCDIDDINYKVSNFLASFVNKGGVIAIKSPMGTGKTQCLVTLLEKFYSERRILYLSHRQTFSKNIEGTFKKFKFYNYMDDDTLLFEKDRIIVQIDSLHKLNENGNHNPFDLVIMDEVVSLLFHLSSVTLKNRLFICELLQKYVEKAKWVLCLDADFDQRAFDWLTVVRDKPKILINKLEPIKKRLFLLTSNYEIRKAQIIEDVKSGKNIVIVSLSLGKSNDLYAEIKKITTKVVCHNSMSSDDLKNKLINVNEFWIQYKVVIFTPSIESGVDFNVQDYFYRMYCFLNVRSATPRCFLQMTGRIRHLINNDVRVHYDKNMKFICNDTYVPTVTEIENIIIKHNKDYVPKGTIDNANGSFNVVYRDSKFTKLFAENYLETYQSEFVFLHILKELIIEKNHYYRNEDLKDDDVNINNLVNECTSDLSSSQKREISIAQSNDGFTELISTRCSTNNKYEIEMLLNVEDATEYEYQECKDRKNTNRATQWDKYVIKRYDFKKLFKIDTVTDDFVCCWYKKEYILYNILHLYGALAGDKKDILKNDKEKIQYFKDILNLFGFKKMTDFETKVELTDELRKKIKTFYVIKSYKEYSKMMGIFRKRIQKDKEDDIFDLNKAMKIFNCILSDYGIKIETIKKHTRTKEYPYTYLFSLNININFLGTILKNYNIID